MGMHPASQPHLIFLVSPLNKSYNFDLWRLKIYYMKLHTWIKPKQKSHSLLSYYKNLVQVKQIHCLSQIAGYIYTYIIICSRICVSVWCIIIYPTLTNLIQNHRTLIGLFELIQNHPALIWLLTNFLDLSNYMHAQGRVEGLCYNSYHTAL